jgi:hypothetical protein
VIASVRESQQFLSSKFDEFNATIKQLISDNHTLKKDVHQLQTTSTHQQQQITTITNELQEVKQQLLQKDLVLSGLPNLANISADTIMLKVSQIYDVDQNDIEYKQVITGKNKISKTPFNMMFLTMRTVLAKQNILSKQKTIGPILWDQLTLNVPENIKMNKIRFNNRLTQHKQYMLTEGKNFSKNNKEHVPFVWDKNGKILLKEANASRPIVLNSMADLEAIRKKYEQHEDND